MSDVLPTAETATPDLALSSSPPVDEALAVSADETWPPSAVSASPPSVTPDPATTSTSPRPAGAETPAASARPLAVTPELPPVASRTTTPRAPTATPRPVTTLAPLTSVTRPDSPDLGRRVAFAAMGGLVLLGVGLIVLSSGSSDEPHPRVTQPASAASAAAPAALASAALVTSPGEGTDVDASAAVVTAPQVQRPPPVWRVRGLEGDASVDLVEGTFGKGDTLASALGKAGISAAESKRVARAFEGLKRVDRGLGPKDTFLVARDRAKGTVLAIELARSPTDVWQARAEPDAKDGVLVAKKLELFVERRPLSAALVVTSDLAKAVSAARLHDDVLHIVDDALEGHIESSRLQIRPGTRVRLVGHEELVEGAFARTKLDAIEVLPRSGNPLRVYWYERDPDAPGKRRAPAAGFYDAKSQQPYKGAFRSPVPLARITSRFNPRRLHPVLKVVMPHNGIDFGAGTGTPVYASAPGTVVLAGSNGPCGNMVEIEHPGGLHTAYCHLSRFAAGLHSGQRVDARQLVGYVGQTGRATGPHLHFAVKRGTMFIDPLSMKLDGVRVLPPVDRDVFARLRGELDAKLDGIALPSAADIREPDPKDTKEDEDLHGEE